MGGSRKISFIEDIEWQVTHKISFQKKIIERSKRAFFRAGAPNFAGADWCGWRSQVKGDGRLRVGGRVVVLGVMTQGYVRFNIGIRF